MTLPTSPNLDQLLRHAAFVRRLALALCVDPNQADDAVQDTWLTAMRAPPPRDRNLRGWLAHALRNVLRQRGRGDERRRRRDAATRQLARTC
jgi:DNA-directed RNA polymerase specialized sigma24 family protein